MEIKKKKISFYKTSAKHTTFSGARAFISIEWLKDMNITKENPEIEMFFDGEQIIIKKAKKA